MLACASVNGTPPCQAKMMVHELAHACGWRHGDGQGVPAHDGSVTSIQGGMAEFKLNSFDGERVKGRLLLGATVEPLVIDARLREWIDVELRDLRTCGDKQVLEYFLPDFYAPRSEMDTALMLQPGFLYGKDLSFFLFSKLRMKLLPQCFEADLWVWSLDRRVITKHPISVRRTDIAADAPLKQPETP